MSHSVRYCFLALWGILFLTPLLVPFGRLFPAENIWHETQRIFGLARTSLEYVALVWLFCGPIGLGLAWILFRTDLLGRKFFLYCFLLGLFIPLPIYAIAWQGLLSETKSRWDQGMISAAWIQAMAALPWVVCLTGLAWKFVPRSIEEEALLFTSITQMILRISLHWVLLSFLMVLFHVGITAFGEIAITDLMLVRTFAEEVYTQFVASDYLGLNRAVQVSLPPCVIISLGLMVYIRYWNQTVLNRVGQSMGNPVYSCGRFQYLAFGLTFFMILFFLGLPLAKLIHLTGGGETPRGFSIEGFFHEMVRIIRLHFDRFLASLMTSLLVGLLTTFFALGVCLAINSHRGLQMVIFLSCAFLWSLPSPILGVGLKGAIEWGMDTEEFLFGTRGPIRVFLYEIPTPLPTIYAQMLKVFPPILGYLYLVHRNRSIELTTEGKLLGLSRWAFFRHIDWPILKSPALLGLLLGTALSMSELSTSKLVQVPGQQTFVQIIFDQMHYGATSTVSGLALIPICFWALILPLLWYLPKMLKLT
jgi:ABC-type Fe3+ transport system permease subunit